MHRGISVQFESPVVGCSRGSSSAAVRCYVKRRGQRAERYRVAKPGPSSVILRCGEGQQEEIRRKEMSR